MTNLLEFKNVCKNFGEKQILKNLNLEIKPNKIIGVMLIYCYTVVKLERLPNDSGNAARLLYLRSL